MHILSLIISLIIIGLIAGALARLIIPGKQHLSIGAAIVIGIVGSFVGGVPERPAVPQRRPERFFQPSRIIGAVIVLFLWLRFGPNSARR